MCSTTFTINFFRQEKGTSKICYSTATSGMDFELSGKEDFVPFICYLCLYNMTNFLRTKEYYYYNSYFSWQC